MHVWASECEHVRARQSAGLSRWQRQGKQPCKRVIYTAIKCFKQQRTPAFHTLPPLSRPRLPTPAPPSLPWYAASHHLGLAYVRAHPTRWQQSVLGVQRFVQGQIPPACVISKCVSPSISKHSNRKHTHTHTHIHTYTHIHTHRHKDTQTHRHTVKSSAPRARKFPTAISPTTCSRNIFCTESGRVGEPWTSPADISDTQPWSITPEPPPPPPSPAGVPYKEDKENQAANPWCWRRCWWSMRMASCDLSACRHMLTYARIAWCDKLACASIAYRVLGICGCTSDAHRDLRG